MEADRARPSLCFAAFTAMAVNGIFSTEPSWAYSSGNSAYISAPVSCALAALTAAAVFSLLERTNADSLQSLLRSRFGRLGSALLVLPLAAALVICAARPISVFAQVLHRQVYDGSGYFSILAFIIPVTFFMAAKGARSVSGTAVCVAFVFAGALIAGVLLPMRGFETYRLYPIMGDGAGHMLRFAASDELFVAAPLVGLCAFGNGFISLSNVKRGSLIAAAAAAFLIAVCRFAEGLAYDPKTLSDMLMPLYRLSFVSPRPGALVRFDKLMIMLWLSGCMVSSAYCITAAAELLEPSAENAKIPRLPMVICMAAVLLIVILPLRVPDDTLIKARLFVSKYGAILLLPTLAAAAAAALKTPKRNKRSL